MFGGGGRGRGGVVKSCTAVVQGGGVVKSCTVVVLRTRGGG